MVVWVLMFCRLRRELFIVIISFLRLFFFVGYFDGWFSEFWVICYDVRVVSVVLEYDGVDV